jgi:hypothetical protein
MCDRDLPPDSAEACICSYECTFCADCVDRVLLNVCPNCGGGFASRPIRPKAAHRDGTGLQYHPASIKRRTIKWAVKDLEAFSAKLCGTPPAKR